MNLLRGDLYKFISCSTDDSNIRLKPLRLCYEKEIVLYAHYNKLKYMATECTYAGDAYRGDIKELVKMLAGARPSILSEIVQNSS